MGSPGAGRSRRAVLAAGAGSVLAACVSSGGRTAAGGSSSGGPQDQAQDQAQDQVQGRLREQLRGLEREHSARLGVFARNVRTGATAVHRADERFPICSTFKPLAVAAVLRDRDRNGEFLARRIRYTEADLVDHSPVTGTTEHVSDGMTVAELCAAALSHSDNGAANLLLRELGGPGTVTRFCRSVGDTTTRLDRWEPELNSAEPGRVEDTSSPRALGGTYARLTIGDALTRQDAKRLTDWLRASTTGGKSFGAGLPDGWTRAEKTGSGAYGTNNDVGIVWTPDRSPVVLAVLTTKKDADAPADYPLVAETTALLASALG
ncbi:class A beta-lactamase [Streptomyces sp. NPDC088725]|uniref:class A beta-lactamase n=1 Tax=Streptomyces sp. NPDC088725 TaxID=3365873 RepID=UPI003804F971